LGMRSVPPAVAGGSNDYGLPIGDLDWRNPIKLIGNPQSQTDNPKTPPATAGGADLIPK